MKTLKLTQRLPQNYQSIGFRVGVLTVLAVLISISLGTKVFAYTQINQQLDYGEENSDVTSLQQFLAGSPSLYPEGLVTGYFGSLTRQAVMRFQGQYNIVSSGTAASTGYGRVGPSTLAKLNALIGTGVANVSAPIVAMQYLPQITATTATFNWMTTNGVALGRMYYSTTPLQMNEGDINSNGFAVTSGQLGSYDGSHVLLNHQLSQDYNQIQFITTL